MSLKMLKQVEQKHRNGCGPAALACMLGITYERALKLVHPRRRPYGRVGTNLSQMIAALDRMNISWVIPGDKSKYRQINENFLTHFNRKVWSSPKHNALVSIYIDMSEFVGGHWIVWDAEQKRFIDSCEKMYKRTNCHITYKQYVKAFKMVVEY